MALDRRSLLKLGSLGAAVLACHSLLPRQLMASGSGQRHGAPLRILILGGTGFTGPHQVRYALQQGHQVTLFNRGSRSLDWPGEVEQLTGDRDIGELSALQGRQWDVCIDNPSSVPHWVRDAGAVLAGNVGHYVLISSISALASHQQPGQDENAPVAEYQGEDAMAETMAGLRANMALFGPLKARCEQEAEKQFPGITTVIRPGLIVGPGDQTDRFSYWPLRLERGGEVLAPGDGSDPVQFIDARDLAEWTIRMAEQRAYGIYHATGPDFPLSMAAMLYGIRAQSTAAARVVWVPEAFLRKHKVSPWSDLPVWMPGSGEMAGFARVANARAIARGLRFRSLADTTTATLDWFRAQPEERQQTVRAGMDAQREAEVLAAWHAR